jgi:hypothetical protein
MDRLPSSAPPVLIQNEIYLQSGMPNLVNARKLLRLLGWWILTGHVRRWIYCLFLAIDANFRLRLKARGIKDPELGSGLAYFVDTTKFQEHLKNRTHEGEVSLTASSALDGVDELNRSRPVGLSSTR